MGLFSKLKPISKSGWLSISFQADGVCAAYVKRHIASKPEVEWVSFYPSDTSARPAILARLEREHGTASYHCSSLLSLGDYQLLSVDAPAVPADELKQAVRWRLRDMLDYSVDEATIDMLAVPSDKGAGSRSGTLFAVSARNQVIGQLHGWFDEAKLAVKVIDIPEMAQRNMAALLEPEGRAIALMSVNADGGLLTVTFDGELYFSRRIDVTAAQLEQNNEFAITTCHERITLELQRSLDHFDRQHNTIPVSKLLIAPINGDAASLVAYLSANLHVPTELLNLESVLDLSRAPELRNLEAQQRYFMVLGAALRHEEGVG